MAYHETGLLTMQNSCGDLQPWIALFLLSSACLIGTEYDASPEIQS